MAVPAPVLRAQIPIMNLMQVRIFLSERGIAIGLRLIGVT